MYDNVHDADMRLTGTVIRYKNKAAYVESVHTKNDGAICLVLRMCVEKMSHTVLLSDKNLDISSPPLGYIPINTVFAASYAYAVRMPARRQQQGVRPDRIVLYECADTPRPIRNLSGLVEIGKCIEANFPFLDSYKESYDYRDSREVTPFSRDIAATSKFLFYRGHKVGSINKDENGFIVKILAPSFRYYKFQEVLNEDWRFDWN